MYDLTTDEEWYMLSSQKAVFRKEQPVKAETNCTPASKPLSSVPQQLAPNVYSHKKIGFYSATQSTYCNGVSYGK